MSGRVGSPDGSWNNQSCAAGIGPILAPRLACMLRAAPSLQRCTGENPRPLRKQCPGRLKPSASASTSSSRLTSRRATPEVRCRRVSARYSAQVAGRARESSSTDPCWSSAPARLACALPTSLRPRSSSSSWAAGRAKQSATAATSRASRRRLAGIARGVVRTPERRQTGRDRLVDARARFEHPAAEDRIRRSAHHRVGDLLVVEHGAATARTAHHVDAVSSAGLEIHVVDRLHPTETQTRRVETVETHRARDLAASAGVEQRQVATHVLLTAARARR